MKSLIAIAFRDFQDMEYSIPKEILEKAGIETKTISSKKGLAIGSFGETILIEEDIFETQINDYDSLIFVGGGGCLPDLDNQYSYKLIKEAVIKNKLLAAICISPVILAKAGVLDGKKATVWNSPMDQFPVRKLKEGGAIYQNDSIVVDGKIITARGPEVAKLFGEKIVELLTRK